MIRFYAYKGCDSCRRARKWLLANAIDFEEIPIRECPPTLEELQCALKAKGSLKPLFNTSGVDYRKMSLKDQLPDLSENEALTLLNSNGNLIKRPFLIGKGLSLVGFKEAEWTEAFSQLTD